MDKATTSNYDRRTVPVLETIRDIIEPADILLFGSRARGDWNDNSDIDILTIAEWQPDTKRKYQQALLDGQAKALEIYGHQVKIDLVRYSPADFEYYRQAKTHLTHSATREGISMTGEATGCGNRYPEPKPNRWPDVEQRFTNYQRQVLAAQNNLDAGLGYEEVGYNMQRCLENALKGFLAYLEFNDGQDNRWQQIHDIGLLQNAVMTFEPGRQALGSNDFSFLTDYAITIPYQGVQDPLPDEASVLDQIKETVQEMMRFVENDAGLDLPRYSPPGPRN